MSDKDLYATTQVTSHAEDTKDARSDHVMDEKHAGVKEINTASVELSAAIQAQKPNPRSKNMIQLYGIMVICYLISTMNGYDGSLMGGVNAMPAFQKSFGLNGAGSSAGILFIIYNLGQIAAFPACGFIADQFGRRWSIFSGCLLIQISTIVQTSAQSLGGYQAGRFVLGMGTAIAMTGGPTYAVELAHPAYRGFMAGMYNNFWWVGNIIAGWTTYGSELHMTGSWAWRTPTLVQCAMPAIAMVCILFFPESPRWLIDHDRTEEALAILAKYHGDGDVNAPIVKLEYQEICDTREASRDPNPWWNFKELIATPSMRYRMYMALGMSFFGQWSGNNVVSYFMPLMIKQAGIKDSKTQLLLNAINPIFSLCGAIYGAYTLDKIGRRKMLLGGLIGGLFCYCLLTAFTAETKKTPNLSYGTIVSIYLYGIVFAWGFTSLQALYPVECLTTRMRAKGSATMFLLATIATMVNTYGIAVGIEVIGWKLYLVFIGWLCVEIACVYFFAVETAGKTLEELKSVFEARNPVKASLVKTKVDIDSSGHVLNINGTV